MSESEWLTFLKPQNFTEMMGNKQKIYQTENITLTSVETQTY